MVESLQGRFQRLKYMEIIAFSKSVRVSPRKTRLVADAIRKMPIANALSTLSVLRQRAAIALNKTLKSAVANARNNAKLEEENLVIKSIEISEGPAFKRFRPSTRGRVHPYKKRTSNIKVILADRKTEILDARIKTNTKTESQNDAKAKKEDK